MRFTREERIVIIFLLAALFAGTAALYCKKLCPATSRFIAFDESEIEKSRKININTAGIGELTNLKGVGPALAARIVAYREKYGPFKKAEDIKNVKGIGDKTYEKMKEEIALE